MRIINLPNGESFRTPSDVAGEFIEKIVSFGDEVTLSDLNELDADTKEIVDQFIEWNDVCADKESGYLYLKKKLENTWKMSGDDMTFDEFIEEFYTEL